MTLWRKCILAPDVSVGCSSCGKRVGVPWAAIAAAVPIALGIAGAARLPFPWSLVSLVVGVGAYVALQRFVVPIVGREI